MMKVILTEDVPNLGVVGDMVAVRDGFGRNYLIPRGKAVFASVRSVAELDHQKRLASHHRKQATDRAQGAKKQVEALSVTMSAKVAPPQLDEEGRPIQEKLQKLFGSITNRDIAKVLAELGVKIDARRIQLSEPIRTVGKYGARIRLDGGVDAELPFWVIPEGALDVEAEKRRVEAAQDAVRKEREQAAAEAAAKEAALRAADKAAAKEAAARATEEPAPEPAAAEE